VFGIVVIVCASPAQGLDLSMHMRERRARCAGPDFRGRSSRDHHRLASGRRSSLQVAVSGGMAGQGSTTDVASVARRLASAAPRAAGHSRRWLSLDPRAP
jgi:hypothetical protein